jgi:hypothetical protein
MANSIFCHSVQEIVSSQFPSISQYSTSTGTTIVKVLLPSVKVCRCVFLRVLCVAVFTKLVGSFGIEPKFYTQRDYSSKYSRRLMRTLHRPFRPFHHVFPADFHRVHHPTRKLAGFLLHRTWASCRLSNISLFGHPEIGGPTNGSHTRSAGCSTFGP